MYHILIHQHNFLYKPSIRFNVTWLAKPNRATQMLGCH